MIIMANKVKGQRTFQVGNDTYTVHFDFNALAELEDATGMTVPQISEQMQDTSKISIKFIRSLMWAGLLKHHGLCLEEVGELISQGNMNDMFVAAGEAFATSMLTEEQIKELEAQQKAGQKKVAIQAQK
jgi:tRNA A-37 threonylcarbamoyl transferase component Bud32